MNVIDRRRNLGPANAVSLKFDTDAASEVDETQQPNSQFFIKTGSVANANGSSYIENEGTIVTCSVFGPRPNFTKGFNQQATIRVTLQCGNFLSLDSLKPGLSEKEATGVIQGFLTSNCLGLVLLDKYPKSNIELFVDLVALNGAHTLVRLLNIVQNAVNVALLDSGLNLKGVAACGYVKEGANEVVSNCVRGSSYNVDDGEEILGVYSECADYDNFDGEVSQAVGQAKQLRIEINRFLIEGAEQQRDAEASVMDTTA